MEQAPAATITDTPAPGRCLWAKWLAAIALLALFAALTINAAVRQSATYDEPQHLVAGYSYLRWGDYRLNPEHPPLLNQLCAVPLLFLPVWPASPELTEADFTARHCRPTTTRVLQEAWANAVADNGMQFYFSQLMFYGLRDDALARLRAPHPLQVPTTAEVSPADFVNDAQRLLFWGRLPVTLLGVLLAVVVFLWARELWGWPGGLVALALVCCDPNFIAHAGLVTTDVGAALLIFATVYFFWRTSRQFTAVNVALTAVCCGLAFAAKFSAVVLVPVLGLLGAWTMARRRWGRTTTTDGVARGPGPWQWVRLAMVMSVVTWAVVWAVYGLRYSAAADPARVAFVETKLTGQSPHGGHHPLETVTRYSAAIQQLLPLWPEGPPREAVERVARTVELGWSHRLVLAVAHSRLLPESYLYGFAVAEMKSHVRSAYLRGRYSNTGFWNYFLWTFLLKTPLPALLLIAVAVALVAWRQPVSLFLLVPVAVYVALSMTSNLNIGHRHLLPAYPFLYVLAGGVVVLWQQWPARARAWSAAVTLAAVVTGAFVVWWRPARVQPHPLAYFNELAGGPKQGAAHLVDSNLDWGQDLPLLKRWLERNHIQEPVALCYFGTANPLAHGIRYHNLPGGFPFAPVATSIPDRGWLVISATNRKGVYYSPEGRAAWDELLRRATLVDTLGYSLYIYRLRATD